MLIFWEQRLVFLATPKAGSTAIESALEPLSNLAVQRPAALKHTNFAAYRAFIAPWLTAVTGERFTTVALMREPLDWLRSWYRFKLRDDETDPDHAMKGVNFEAFARSYIEQGGPTADLISQVDFLTDGGARADVIFRYDDIHGFATFMEEQLDCVLSLPRLNVPPTADVALEAEAEALLRRLMERDTAFYRALPEAQKGVTRPEG